METIQISIKADQEQQEILISELDALGAEGFEQTDEYLIAYFGAHSFKSYEVNELLKDYQIQTNTIEEQNWNALWENNFQPVVVGEFCSIRAEFHQPAKGVAYDIVITPKMSFGTGHHATTYMMIEQMREIDFVGKDVFDFGTGTGILAILAEKLGAANITAIDVDEWSIRNAKENAVRNNCSRITLSLSSEIPVKKYDIILANINRNVILGYLDVLSNCVGENNWLLISGLLTTDEKDIVEACKLERLYLLKRSERNQWISLLFKKAENGRLI